MINSIRQKTEVLAMHRAANYAIVALIFAAALSYVYFANKAVHALTVLEKVERGMQSLSVKVSEMESKRLLVENSMNSEMASRLGFVEINHPTFITRNLSKTTLSLKVD